MNLAEKLSKAYEKKAELVEVASPSHPNFEDLSVEAWHEAWRQVSAEIYALEESLAGLDPD